MHLERPNLTTTSTKKRKEKITKSKQQELENGWRNRNQWLKELHLPKETFEQYLEWVYGRGKKTKTQKVNESVYPKTVPTTRSSKSSLTSEPLANNNENHNWSSKGDTDNKMAPVTHGKLWITGAVTTKQTPKYTGSKIIGISVLHKSCLQPMFSNEEILDVARMRR